MASWFRSLGILQRMAFYSGGILLIALLAFGLIVRSTVSEPTTRTTVIVLLAGAAIFVVAGVAIFLIARGLAGPLQRLAQAMKDVAEGEADLTRRVELATGGEVAEVCYWFNDFVGDLHDVVSKIASLIDATASASAQIGATSEQISKQADDQSEQTNQVATSTVEMAATIQEMAKNAQAASEGARQNCKQADQGGALVRDIVQAMDRLQEVVRQATATISSLAERSEEIGKIIATINAIADQTNLLALNAAIEAARAGEHGRGFAVVADEVRRLAERTTNATQEIARTLNLIREGTESATDAMRLGTKEVEEKTKLATEAGHALQSINQSATQVTQMVEQIAIACEEQSATGEEISRNIETIANLADRFAMGAQEAARAARDLMERVEGLQAFTRRFKLKEDGTGAAKGGAKPEPAHAPVVAAAAAAAH